MNLPNPLGVNIAVIILQRSKWRRRGLKYVCLSHTVDNRELDFKLSFSAVFIKLCLMLQTWSKTES